MRVASDQLVVANRSWPGSAEPMRASTGVALQGLAQHPQFFLECLGAVGLVGQFAANAFAQALAQPVHRYREGVGAHAQAFAQPAVLVAVGTFAEEGRERIEQAAAAAA